MAGDTHELEIDGSDSDRSDGGDSRPDREAATRSGESGPDGSASPEPILELDGVTRTFGAETAVDDLDLSVQAGELLTLLGPSGCGKTTTLRLLAGLETPDAGTIRVDGELVAEAGGPVVAPEHRDVGIVFQEFALFPHLSFGENVAFGLTDADGAETDRRVEELLELVGLSGRRGASPDELSGGQRQRVALARSLAPEPTVLLLDEPFSNLDVSLRVEMREEVRHILKEAGVTAVSVTHDQEEALSISDRVAVMSDGQIEQVGRPETVFEHPESRFVADFLGQTGFLTGRFEGGTVETPLATLPAEKLEGLSPAYEGATVDVLVRPDDLRATPATGTEADGRIVHRQYTGPAFVYRVELDTGDVVHCQQNHASQFELGQTVAIDLVADHTLAWYPAE